MLYIFPRLIIPVYRNSVLSEPLAVPVNAVVNIRKNESHCSEGFLWSLPLRYARFTLRRRLIRMMLTLEKNSKCQVCSGRRVQNILAPAADYVRSVIDTAMLKGELRCRPSGEMARTYLSQAEDLVTLLAGARQDKALLRREVRRRTAEFLQRYAPVKVT